MTTSVFTKILLLLTVQVLQLALQENIDISRNVNNNFTEINSIKGLEVPDSSLILLDRINLRKLKSTRAKKPKRKQTVGTNSTLTAVTSAPVVAPATNSTSSSSSSEDDDDSRRCVCELGVCKCCTGPVLDLFNQKACMRVTYHPGDFAFDVAMSWNDRVLYENSLSGKNPRPICLSPPRLNNIKLCAKFYNVFFPGRNFHFCLAMSGQWRSFELFNVAFDCLRMGANGIAMLKPDEAGGLVIPNPQGGVDAVIDQGDDIEDYDENVVKSLFDIFERKRR